MKQIFYMVLVLCCMACNAEEIAAKESIQHDLFTGAASEDAFIYICPSDFFIYAANKENNQHTFQRLFPSFHKYPVSGYMSSTGAGSKKYSSTDIYAAKAENHIARFEGTDMIHPFNYFW